MKIEYRFKGSLSDEYSLNKKVYPHQKKIHELISKTISGINKNRKNTIKILEIGCGTGETTKEVLKLNKNINLTLIDNSNSMIKQCQKNIRILKKKIKIEFIQEDALKYLRSCKSQKFDIIFSAYTIHNFTNHYRSNILKNIFRILKKEGYFINGDIIYSSNDLESKKEFRWLAQQLEKYIFFKREDLKKKWLKHITEDRNLDRILIEKNFIKSLFNIGFKKVDRILRFNSDAIIIAKK